MAVSAFLHISRKRWPLLGAACLVVAGCAGKSGGLRQQSQHIAYTGFSYSVAVPVDAGPEVEAFAREVAALVVPGRLVLKVIQNPTCCFFVNVTRWTPGPGQPGYVIIIQPGGAILEASDPEQMRLAIERLEQSRRMMDGKPQFPIGLMTNYPVVPDEPSQPSADSQAR